jgi:hypothetical protein
MAGLAYPYMSLAELLQLQKAVFCDQMCRHRMEAKETPINSGQNTAGVFCMICAASSLSLKKIVREVG